MKVFSPTLLCLALLPAPALADEPPPLALTPEEVAAGWVELFDGQDFSGLLIEGNAEIVDHILVVGGPKAALLRVRRELGDDFELRLFYRTEGWPGLIYHYDKHGLTGYSTGQGSVPEPPCPPGGAPEWRELRCRCQGGNRITLESWRDGRPVPGDTLDLGRSGGAPAVWFEVPAGTKLFLRGAQARPDPTAGAWWRTTWGFGAAFLAGFLAVVVAVLVFVRLMRRRLARPAGPPPAPGLPPDDVAEA
jgi:hypothetical protein